MSKDATAKAELTQARLKELLHYDPDTGVFTRLVTTSSRSRAGQVAGGFDKKLGYIQIMVDRRKYFAHRLAWLYVYGEWPSADLDHRNRNRADNRLGNLRPASRSQNCANSSLSRTSKSGAKGVSWNTKSQKWVAQIVANGRKRYLGRFDDINEAAAAYAEAARDAFGEYAHIA